MSKQVSISVATLLEIALHGRPFAIIKDSEEIYSVLNAIPVEQRELFVIENNEWSVGWSGGILQQMQPGLYRLWNKTDWALCDNRNKQRIGELHAKRAEKEALHTQMVSAVKASLLVAGIKEQVIDMLLATNTEEQLKQMFDMLPKG